MPVIINDFQIMVEPPPERQTRGGVTAEAEQQAPPASPKMKPEEVTAVACVNRERMERVRAD